MLYAGQADAQDALGTHCYIGIPTIVLRTSSHHEVRFSQAPKLIMTEAVIVHFVKYAPQNSSFVYLNITTVYASVVSISVVCKPVRPELISNHSRIVMIIART